MGQAFLSSLPIPELSQMSFVAHLQFQAPAQQLLSWHLQELELYSWLNLKTLIGANMNLQMVFKDVAAF